MSRFRAIVRIEDASMAANVGGAVWTDWATVEFDCPELARVIRLASVGSLRQVSVVGVEHIDPEEPSQ